MVTPDSQRPEVPQAPPESAPSTKPDPLGGSWGWFPWLIVLCAVSGGGALIWRSGAFSELKPSPQRASAGAVARGPSLADAYDLTSPRWPSLCAALPSREADVECGPFTTETIEGMSGTYGFYLAQQHSVQDLSSRFPSLRAELLAAEDEFDRKFQRTFDNIDRLLAKNMPEWPHVRRQVEKVLTSQPAQKPTTADAQALLNGIRARIGGKF